MVCIDPSVVRTSHPFLLGETIQEEVDCDIQIPEVGKTSKYPINKEFTSKELDSPSLARMMEQEIVHIVDEWRRGERVFPARTNKPKEPCVWIG
jgi:hypothetical protein